MNPVPTTASSGNSEAVPKTSTLGCLNRCGRDQNASTHIMYGQIAGEDRVVLIQRKISRTKKQHTGYAEFYSNK